MRDKSFHLQRLAKFDFIESRCRIGKRHGREIKLYFSHRSGFKLLPSVMTLGFKNRNSCRRVTQFFFFNQNRANDDAVVRIHSRDDLKICLD